MSAPMTVNEIRVHGATNTRTGFLDPIFAPLVGAEANSPSTIGEVIAKLRVASGKLDGLRKSHPSHFEPALTEDKKSIDHSRNSSSPRHNKPILLPHLPM